MALADHIRHPRRLGFIGFNLAALALVVVWAVTRSDSAEAGLAGLPNVVLSTGAIVVIAIVWLGAWLAWGAMVWSRRQRQQQKT
jgi:hypothetical protein